METTYDTKILRDGKTVRLATYHYERDDHIESSEDIMCRTKTGKKVHLSSPGSSVTRCGHWMKVNASYFKLDPARVESATLCEHCYPAGAQDPQ